MKDTNFIKKDPTDIGKLTVQGIRVALAKLDTLLKAGALLDRQTAVLAYNDGKTSSIRRVLDEDLDALIDAELAEFSNGLVQKLITELIEELDANGVTVTEQAMAILNPAID
jgi:hypothetical protein